MGWQSSILLLTVLAGDAACPLSGAFRDDMSPGDTPVMIKYECVCHGLEYFAERTGPGR
jgi:hypothetical protein